jgi:hypothetical protein
MPLLGGQSAQPQRPPGLSHLGDERISVLLELNELRR